MLSLKSVVDLLIKNDLLKECIYNNQWTYECPKVVQKKEIQSIAYDSRKVIQDTLFFCKGIGFKQEYLESAIHEGATIYVAETPYEIKNETIALIVTDVKKAMSLVSMAYYDYPQNKLKVIAYTGTKGKTTSAYFTKYILAEATNNKVAMISTMETILDGKTATKSKLTTPESLDLYEMMNQAVCEGMTHLVMEVSSQAYKTGRVFGLKFDVGIFLNISLDHIGAIEHPTFDDYFYCKRQLLKNCRSLIINREADYFDLMVQTARYYCKNVLVYGENRGVGVDYSFKLLQPSTRFELTSKNDPLNIKGCYQTKLPGDFNQSNAVSAILASALVGATMEDAQKGLQIAKVPGRMETQKTTRGAFVYIDYAHNYLSVKSLLSFVKKEHPDGKLFVVIGSTGDKGLSRRKDFSRALSEFADKAILTTDDPGFEDPKSIVAEIKAGISEKVEVETIIDREKAIEAALMQAQSGDIVVLAGKGSDPSQLIEGQFVPYDSDPVITEKLIGSGL